jgi:hypothetical protein
MKPLWNRRSLWSAAGLTQLSQLLTAANDTLKFKAPLTKCKAGKAASNPQHSKGFANFMPLISFQFYLHTLLLDDHQRAILQPF